MNIRAIGATLGLATAVAACSVRQEPVPLSGAPGDIDALVGEWIGEYSSIETGRSGQISFTLAARGDTAHGEVVMIPRGASGPLRAEPGEPEGAERRPVPEVLTIRFVRVTGDRVSGSLAPYRDPECGCALHTSFDGRLEGNVIEGTFQTRHGQTNAVLRGRWRVVRTPPGSTR